MQTHTTDHIFQSTWETISKHWKEFIAFPIAIYGILILLQTLFMDYQNPNSFSIYTVLFLIINAIFGISFSTATLKWCDELNSGKKTIDLAKGMRYGFGRFWGVVGTSLLLAIKVLLWSLLLIIPGIYKAIQYSQSVRVSQLEKISGGDANKISKSIIMGSGILRTLGNYLVMYLLTTTVVIFLATFTIIVSTAMHMTENAEAILSGILMSIFATSAGLFAMIFLHFQYLFFKEENKKAISKQAKALK